MAPAALRGAAFGPKNLEADLKPADEASGARWPGSAWTGEAPVRAHERPVVPFGGLEGDARTVTVRAWGRAGNLAESSCSVHMGSSSLNREVASAIMPPGAVSIATLSLAAMPLISRRRVRAPPPTLPWEGCAEKRQRGGWVHPVKVPTY